MSKPVNESKPFLSKSPVTGRLPNVTGVVLGSKLRNYGPS